jgi:hypothetical protein
MLVRGPGIPDQRCGLLIAAPVLAKGHECPGIEPERAAVLMGGQQLLERAVIVLFEQAPGDGVPDPLIVVRVQLEHVAVVGEGAVDVAKLQERARDRPWPAYRGVFRESPRNGRRTL